MLCLSADLFRVGWAGIEAQFGRLDTILEVAHVRWCVAALTN
jgi:hypothetical protein